MAIGYVSRSFKIVQARFVSFLGQKLNCQGLPGLQEPSALRAATCRHERALSSALTLQECAKAPNGSDLRTPNSVQHCPPSTQLTHVDTVVSIWLSHVVSKDEMQQHILRQCTKESDCHKNGRFMVKESEINFQPGCQLRGNC